MLLKPRTVRDAASQELGEGPETDHLSDTQPADLDVRCPLWKLRVLGVAAQPRLAQQVPL